jgi:hypothetical protein
LREVSEPCARKSPNLFPHRTIQIDRTEAVAKIDFGNLNGVRIVIDAAQFPGARGR